jgi:hypothetical protein
VAFDSSTAAYTSISESRALATAWREQEMSSIIERKAAPFRFFVWERKNPPSTIEPVEIATPKRAADARGNIQEQD